jgi:tRNA-splicing ligase RtcB (3'-phosphate/5'-hydroxy nucleic acid ligase)
MSIGIERVGQGVWEVEARPDARVPARFVASKELLPLIREDESSLRQLQNMATLPGIVGAAWAMPDMHMGYGFPIGGVAATDLENGVVSPGGVGYDINCGVRLLAFHLQESDVRAHLEHIADVLYASVPCGIGRGGAVRAGHDVMKRVLLQGGRWAVDQGYGSARDLEHVEEESVMVGADPGEVSDLALSRGKDQLGTLGSGNHFMELGVVDEIREPEIAQALGLAQGQVTLILHSGSRGLGHQVCTDSLKRMMPAMRRHGIQVPDPQLCCVPIQSPEGKAYLGAMSAAVNFAFANRQILAALAVRGVAKGLGTRADGLGARTVYEVAHNIAKIETHVVDGKERRVCVHRKGATRAFPPGHAAVSRDYRAVGQPVLIPGDMERYSFVLVGRQKAMETTFGSSCHGAGRRLSRTKARQVAHGRSIEREMAAHGILVRAASLRTQEEEIAAAYKDVAEVVDAVALAGLSTVVARLRPLAVIKG